MPNLMIPESFRLFDNDKMVTEFNNGNWRLHLFKNDFDPAANPTFDAADLTEADFSGYAPIVSNNWATSVTQGDGSALSQDDIRTFTRAAGATSNSVYGYYLMDQTNNRIAFAGRVTDAPVNFNNVGDTHSIRPAYDSQFDNS